MVIGKETDRHGYVELKVLPPGTHAEQNRIINNIDDYIGLQLTIKHLGWTDDGVPRNATAIAIRDYE